MNLFKRRQRGRDKRPKKAAAAQEEQEQPEVEEEATPASAPMTSMESFDDFLNTLSDDDEEDDSQEEVADMEEEDEEEDMEVGEEEEIEEVDLEEEEGSEDDADSIDMDAELEKSLAGEESAGPEAEEGAEEGEDDEVDYFLREEEPDDENTQEETASSLKKSLAGLAEMDPDFFEYLKKNDADLLNFGDGSEEEDSSDEEEGDEEQGLHVPPDELEVASDSEAESAEEDQDIEKDSTEYKSRLARLLQRRVVNLTVISHWETQLGTTRELPVFTQVVDAFAAAVESVLQDKGASEDSGARAWKVEGSANFNALMRLCIRTIPSFATRFLCATNNASFALKSFAKAPLDVRRRNDARWRKLRTPIRAYMNAITIALRSLGNPAALVSVLRHVQEMTGFFALFTSKAQRLVRVLVGLWSAGEDSARIAAFVSLLRMAAANKEFFLERLLKQMYIAYVSNCKFTSPEAWPAINFMRSSLVEIYIQDTRLAYAIAFPFVRQLAIHLRNANMAGSEPQGGVQAGEGAGAAKNSKTKAPRRAGRNRAPGVTADGALGSRKEATRIVVSWQYLHSLHLWAALLGEAASKGDDGLQLLVHPLVQIAFGVIRLVPTRKFIPLRFHVLRLLTELQAKTGAFIPLLPLATGVFDLTDFGNPRGAPKGTNSIARPLNLACCLKADPTESGYAKSVADAVFDSILAVCASIGADPAFPELITPPLYKIKHFLKHKCKNGEVSRRFKTLVEKLEANAKHVEQKRAAAMDAGLVALGDAKAVQVLKIEIEGGDTAPPILGFAREWRAMHAKQVAKLQRAAGAAAGGGGKRGRDGGDETREERLIPRAAQGKKSQGAKKRARMERVMFGDEEEDGVEGGDDSEEGEEFKTLFDGQEEEDEPSMKKKKGKKKQAGEEEVEEEPEPRKKKSKGGGGKKSKKGGKKGKKSSGFDAEGAEPDMQDEIVDFDDFVDSD